MSVRFVGEPQHYLHVYCGGASLETGVTSRSHTHRLPGGAVMVTGSDAFRSCQAAHIVGCSISCLCCYVCTLMYVAVVCATPAVESPGSCCEGAGSLPAARVAAVPKRRLQVPGCSDYTPLPTLPGFKTRNPRALPGRAAVRFLWRV